MDDEILDDPLDDEMTREMMDTRPLLSFDNFVNNRPHNGTTVYMARYIGKVMLGSFPKMLIIVSTITGTACTRYHCPG